MEINIENKELSTYQEFFSEDKHIRDSVETVVPDTCGDILRIVCTSNTVLLKSKDVNAAAVKISGELNSTVLYISDIETRLETVKISKAFEIEYDAEEKISEELVQVSLSMVNYETKAVNPRKLSLVFEISGALKCYKEAAAVVETTLPVCPNAVIHTRTAKRELQLTKLITEKTFSLNEQFIIPDFGEQNLRLLFTKTRCVVNDIQTVGTKLVVKGMAYINTVFGFDGNTIRRSGFSTAFSQIIDTACENICYADGIVELTSQYFEMIDTISGEKALDVELHGVIQLKAKTDTKASYIDDAYCNTMRCECQRKTVAVTAPVERRRFTVSLDEAVNVAEDCEEVLCVISSVNRVETENMKLMFEIGADVIYRQLDGAAMSVHRVISGSAVTDCVGKICCVNIANEEYRSVGNGFDAHFVLELVSESENRGEVNCVSGLILDEAQEFNFSKLPAFTAVRVENESIWELAKRFHSSTERIEECNDIEDICGKMLLIPKTV